jgi:hypothetical protein
MDLGDTSTIHPMVASVWGDKEGLGIQKVVLGIGLALFVGFLALHFVSSDYEGTHILIAAGLLISIVGGIWGHGRERSRHYHVRDSPWEWLATSLFITIGGVVLIAIGIYFALDTMNYRLFFVSVVGLGAILLGRWLAKRGNQIKFRDDLWPEEYECPLCGQTLDRYERSCLGCGSVVWTMMRLREGVYQVPPEKRGKRAATNPRPRRT